MIQLTVPVIILITKLLVNKKVSEGISEGISEAKYEVDIKITKSIFSTFFNIIINIILLIGAIYILPFFFDIEIVIYFICSVYLGSIIYGLYNAIKSIPLILNFVFRHKLNLKEYICYEIYLEAYDEVCYQISNRNLFIRVLNGLFGKSESTIAYSIAYSTTNIVIKKVTSIVIILVTIFLVYVLIFRILVAPVLIEDSTQLDVFQAALYPVLYAVDYFFNTKLLSWLI